MLILCASVPSKSSVGLIDALYLPTIDVDIELLLKYPRTVDRNSNTTSWSYAMLLCKGLGPVRITVRKSKKTNS